MSENKQGARTWVDQKWKERYEGREKRKKCVHPSSNFLYSKEIELERKIKFPLVLLYSHPFSTKMTNVVNF